MSLNTIDHLHFLRNLPAEAMQIIRKIENVKRKIIKCKWSMVFNDTWSKNYSNGLGWA